VIGFLKAAAAGPPIAIGGWQRHKPLETALRLLIRSLAELVEFGAQAMA
jgi:hypothetical protein